MPTCHGAWIDLMDEARASAETFSGARGGLIIPTKFSPGAFSSYVKTSSLFPKVEWC